jgi:hypothetical protein
VSVEDPLDELEFESLENVELEEEAYFYCPECGKILFDGADDAVSFLEGTDY